MTKVSQIQPPSKLPNAPPGWRLLKEEALLRGYRKDDGSPNTRAFAKKLRALGVEIRGTRKEATVCPQEVDAAWARLPVRSAAQSPNQEDDLVASLLQGRP